jgi:4-hydroxybenzoate polyprenyltransferase
VKDKNFHIESTNLKAGFGNVLLEETYCSILKVLRFIVSSSLLLALNGVMVVVFGYFLNGTTIMPPLLLAAFLITFSVYGLNKFTDKTEDAINRPETFPRATGYYLIFSIVSMTFGFLIGLWEGILDFFVLCAPVVIGIIYSVKISKSIPRLKEIVGVKSLVVAVSWALTGAFLPDPFFATKLEIIAVIFVFIFIRVFVGATLCDLLDKNGDLASGVETIPIRLGREKTKKLLLFINSLGLILPIYCVAAGVLIGCVFVLLFGVLFGYLAIWFFFKKNCNRLHAGLILDGEWIPIVIITCLLIR